MSYVNCVTEKSQLIPILESLLSHRLVIKKSKEKVISTDDKFRINMKFTSKMYRVKVNAVQIKESVTYSTIFHSDFTFRKRKKRLPFKVWILVEGI